MMIQLRGLVEFEGRERALLIGRKTKLQAERNARITLTKRGGA